MAHIYACWTWSPVFHLATLGEYIYIYIGQFSIRTPTITVRRILLRADSSVDHLRSTSDQKEFEVAQQLVIDHIHWSSARTQDSGSTTRAQFNEELISFQQFLAIPL